MVLYCLPSYYKILSERRLKIMDTKKGHKNMSKHAAPQHRGNIESSTLISFHLSSPLLKPLNIVVITSALK